jgi:hypothetical protein
MDDGEYGVSKKKSFIIHTTFLWYINTLLKLLNIFMVKQFLVMTFLISFLFSLNSCKKSDDEMMMLIHGHKWGRRDAMPLPVMDDERYEFIEPGNYKHYHVEGGDNVMMLKRDSLTINIFDSKLYIKNKDGSEYKTYTIEKLTQPILRSVLKLNDGKDSWKFHHRQ